MNIKAAFLSLAVAALPCILVATPASAHVPAAKSLLDRCMSEPVAVDHLSCTNIHRPAHKQSRFAGLALRNSKQLLHRRVAAVAGRNLFHKTTHASRIARVEPAFHAKVRSKHQHLARASAEIVPRPQVPTTKNRLEASYEARREPRAPRQRQASAYCSQSATRSSWECQRYFLLAPYVAKNR